MDLSFAVLDGVLRAEGIIDLGVEPVSLCYIHFTLLSKHTTGWLTLRSTFQVRQHLSPQVSSSLFAALLNSAIIGGGVPLLIDMFKLDSPIGDWGLRTPAWVRHPLKGTNDALSATLLAFVYLTLTASISARFSFVHDIVQVARLDKLSTRDIRTFCSLLLGSILLAEKATVLSLTKNPSPKLIAPRSRAVAAAEKSNGRNTGAKNRKQTSRRQQ